MIGGMPSVPKWASFFEKRAKARNDENFNKKWFAELSKKLGILERTLWNWWKAYVAEVGELSATRAEVCQSAIGTDAWFYDLAQTTGTPRRTLNTEALSVRVSYTDALLSRPALP
jgi:hypothetical protein